jgi:hypothetical protein
VTHQNPLLAAPLLALGKAILDLEKGLANPIAAVTCVYFDDDGSPPSWHSFLRMNLASISNRQATI